ncbi:MAG TPA: DUF1080 domain-containing protein [Tepidisphaeraceae bacterium]|jgi:hypothetical protein|nr:DUF1080 domain-containing protein [Tepidisphaeraceae bacterium]
MIRFRLSYWLLLVGLMAAASLAADEEGFQPIFDGKTLEGWKTFDASYWSVQDGAITATITREHPLKDNRYLIWQGSKDAPDGQLADFELKLKSRVRGEGAINNGFQFRSKLLPNGWDIAGYQVDNNLNVNNVSPWLVRLYDEHGRHDLALRGQRTTFDSTGKASKEEIKEASGAVWFKLEEWHEYHLVCIGNRLTLKVDGKLAAEVIDNDAKQFDPAGILALQLHSGPPTIAQFKDIRLKVVKPALAPKL